MDSQFEIKGHGTVYGYRCWRLGKHGSLRSFGPIRSLWKPGEPYVAICWKNFFPVNAHHAPGPGCGCGIYAWMTPPADRKPPVHGARVLWGVAKLWGTVRVADWGYRAQFGRIVALEHALGAVEASTRYGAVLLDRMEDWSNTGP